MATSKKAAAQLIFDEMSASGKARKEIIERMVAEAGLTKAGAATYYTNFKRPPAAAAKKAPVVVTASVDDGTASAADVVAVPVTVADVFAAVAEVEVVTTA